MHISVIGRLVGMATRVGAHPATRGGGLLQHRRKARSPGLAACGGLVLIALTTGGVGLLSGVGPASGVAWASAQGSCDSWVGPVTGTVPGSVGSYWSMGVPAKGVPVCINKDGTYTVVMNNQPHGAVEVGELQVGAASGNPTLEVTGANGNVALYLDAGATVGGHGTHGTLVLEASAKGSAYLEGAKGASLTVSSGGKLSVSGPGPSGSYGGDLPVNVAVPLTNQAGGKVDIAASTGFGDGTPTANSGAFDIAHGASVLFNQDSFTQSAGTLKVSGTLTVSGGGGKFTLAGGTESGGPVDVHSATVVDGPGTIGFDLTGECTLTGDIPAGQTVTVDGRPANASVDLTGLTTVKGTLVLDASAKGSAYLEGAKGASFTVSSGGKLSVSGPGPSGSPATATIAVPLTNQAGGKVDIAASTGFGDDTPTANSGAFDIVHGGQVVLSGGSTLTNKATGTLGVTVDASTKTVSGITGPGVALKGTLAVTTMGSPAVGSSYVAIGGPVTGKFSAYSFGHQHYSVRYTSGKASTNEVLLTFKG